ncbi:Ger(x)C family spore germination protein [Ammoniphilus sp. 3BR4]|uniref:Ger(x)C family spore germination protein n=1 Tax=Ammoniphilus sp. 3BR4 TaxID=3158265 RepID=UPI0034652D4C
MISVILLMTVTGCWNRVELNELAVSTAMGVDKKGDRISISHQVVNPGAIATKGGASSTAAPVTLFQETGSSVQEVARRITTKSTRKIYAAQLQILIIGEELAKEGLGEVLDHITRDHAYRKDFFVVVARGTKAENILKIYTPLERIPASKMQGTLETSSDAWGATSAVKMDQFMSDLISKGKEAVLTGIKVSGNQEVGETKENAELIEPITHLQFNDLAVFKKDKLVGWLNEEESIGYNYTQGEIKSTVVVFPCPQGKKNIVVEVLRTQEDSEFKEVNGKPRMEVNIRVEGNVAEAQCDIDLSKTEVINQLEKLTEQDIKRSIEAAIKAGQKKYQSDIFGFGAVINRTNPKYWDKVKADWDKEFQDLQVNVKVKADIRRVFKTKKSFQERMEE